MRILVVEDERPIAEFIQRGLEAEGYSVACAVDGEEGLALARSGDYALVVLDVLLPKLSGLEVVQGIREIDETVPVIMLTALAETDDVVTGLDLGASDYLTKPFAFAELVARIRVHLRQPGLTGGRRDRPQLPYPRGRSGRPPRQPYGARVRAPGLPDALPRPGALPCSDPECGLGL